MRTGTFSTSGTYTPQRNWYALVGWLSLLVYLAYITSLFDLDFDRFISGLDNGSKFLGRMFPPNFTRYELLMEGLFESLQIGVIATFLGVLISLPMGFLAARNLMPPLVTWCARGV